MTKDEIEKSIFETQIFKEAIKKLSEKEQQETIDSMKKIIEGFYKNILQPFSNKNQ